MSRKSKTKRNQKSDEVSIPQHEIMDGSLRLPVHKHYPVRELIQATDLVIESRKINEIIELIWLPEQLDENQKNVRIIRAVELFESLEPKDGAESMLAIQMVGSHTAAMECLKRAALENQTFEGRDLALRHAQKLMALYTKQLETLNKHRGKGQQKVTVEHVSIAPGGQAIVGNVEAGTKQQADQPVAAALEHKSEMPMEKIVALVPRFA